ncbi:MAG: division/cell wall cluster transcriptional repressor MraZ [bacterium]|nr:division/cell wall cluster transcriptional repressor MraZ [bacterium]MDT8395291.1 division/cell wall cluster transcriptional repressor MraZ [bacterium]
MSQAPFRGRFQHALDDKGRLSIPSRFRDILVQEHDGRLVVTNLPHCLVAYTPGQWEAIESRSDKLSTVKSNVQSFLRFFYSGATECELDRQGRILIPPSLREAVGLDRQVVVAGMLNRLEIWSQSRWDDEMKKAVENFDNISDELADFGL